MKMKFLRGLPIWVLGFTLFCGDTAQANELRGIIRNNEGVKKFGAERQAEAYEKFTGALEDLPFSGEVHFNIGNSFFDNKEYEKALSEYRQALRLSKTESDRDKQVRFRAHFNSGVALTQLKRIDEALEQYQQALEIDPDSLETKTNIELLTASGGKGGEGEKQDKDNQGDKNEDKKDGQGEDEKKDQEPKPDQQSKAKPTPRPFKSEELSKQDVNRILEELKRQEEQIRAKTQREGAKDAPPEKDW